VQEKITYGFENTLNYSHDDFDEDRHTTTIRLFSRGPMGVAKDPPRALIQND
jgi:hypothetical protein